MNTTVHPAAERYLKDLERELADLPRPRRREVMSDIRDHIQEADEGSGDEAQIRTILDELGDPEAIAAEARTRFGVTRRKASFLEGAALILLLIGGLIVPLVGWVVGAVLLWVSRVWTVRDKVIGTLIVPGGLALPMFLIFFAIGPSVCVSMGGRDVGGRLSNATTCTQQPLQGELWGVLLLVLLVVGPIATAIYLGGRAWRTNGE